MSCSATDMEASSGLVRAAKPRCATAPDASDWSVVLERTIERHPTAQRAAFDDAAWSSDLADDELIAALSREPDRVELFEFGLQALLDAL